MPPIPVIADIWRVKLNWSTAAGVTPVNIFHVRSVGGTTTAVGTTIEANLTAAMFTPVSIDHTLRSFDLMPLDGVTAATTVDVNPDIAGGSTGQSIINLSACLTFRSALRGSAGRGRIFLGPTGEDINAGSNVWTGASFTNTPTAWMTFQTALEAAATPVQLVVCSYVHGLANRVNSVTPLSLLRSTKSRLNQVTG